MLLNEASPISSNHSKMPTFSVRRPPRTLADLDAQAVEPALVFFGVVRHPGSPHPVTPVSTRHHVNRSLTR
jgi:hypothetical protein